jgi:hypothetical protein
LSLFCVAGGSAPMARAILSIILSTREFVPLNLAKKKGMLQTGAQDMSIRQVRWHPWVCWEQEKEGLNASHEGDVSTRTGWNTRTGDYPPLAIDKLTFCGVPNTMPDVCGSGPQLHPEGTVQCTHHNSNPSTNKMQAKASMLAHTVP